MNINVFLLCFNESSLLPHTIKHYKKYLPSCKITIYDNESTDDSVKIAEELGCNVVSWSSNNYIDDFKYMEIKNNCWKSIEKGWIIMADMDELLCVTEDDLIKEMSLGTTILNVKGYDMIGHSETVNLSDIDLQEIQKYVDNDRESKNLCFLRENIKEMKYDLGAHGCEPEGDISYSLNYYINKHMSYLGLPFLKNKLIERHKRATEMMKYGLAIHYTQDIDEIHRRYNECLNRCKILI